MNHPQTKRLSRLRSREQKLLDSLVAELQKIQAARNLADQKIAELNETLAQVYRTDLANSIEAIQSVHQRVNDLQKKIASSQEFADNLRRSHEQQRKRVTLQRTKVEGWTRLIDKRNAVFREKEQQKLFLEADDTALRALTRQGKSA